MSANTKIALAAALLVGAASAALANDVETREWAEYLGQKHKHENTFASNTYDSPDWAPIYSGSTIRREPTAGASERNADEFARVPSAPLSHKMDHHQR